MRILKKILSPVPLCLVWIVLSTIFWGWLLYLVTDVPAAQRVTIYTSGCEIKERALEEHLLQNAPEGMRDVKVRSVSYVMFDTDDFKNADLYIMTAKDAEKYFGYSEENGFGEGLLSVDGKTPAVQIYDAATGRGAATEYITYAAPGEEAESFFIFYGAHSRHLGDLNGSPDSWALTVVDRLLAGTSLD